MATAVQPVYSGGAITGYQNVGTSSSDTPTSAVGQQSAGTNGYVNSSGVYVPATNAAATANSKSPSFSGGAINGLGNGSSSYPVVTSGAATANYNTANQDYTQNIKPNMQNAQANAKTQSTLPVIAGYNVSQTSTGNAGETLAKNQATGQSYYITPQKPAATADDVKNIISGSDSGASNSTTPATNQNSSTPIQQNQSNISNGISNENQDYQNKLQNQETEIDQGYAAYRNLIQQIQSGAFPLSAPQQALVDATNQAFQQMTTQTNLKAAALSSETGGVSDKVNAAGGELLNITSDQSAAVAKLELGFQQQNYQMVTDSYKAFQDYESQKSGVIDKLHNSIMDTYNAAQATAQKTTDSINSVALDAAKNGADAKTLAAIKASPDEGSAISAASDYLQTATGQLGDYLQYKRTAEANGQNTEDYNTWKKADDAQTAKEKESEAYGTAFAQTKGKSDAEASSQGSEATSPVVSPSGITYNAPASVAPYVDFASNGVKYVDLSNFAGTPTEKNTAVQDAQSAGYKVITNKNTAVDVQNITNAKANLQSIQDAFDPTAPDSSAARNIYQAALNKGIKLLQTNPNLSAADVFQDSALDIFKAISGTQGFRGGASAIEQVKETFPQITDTKAVVDQKIANLNTLLGNRETVLVGKPSASDQMLIDSQNDPLKLGPPSSSASNNITPNNPLGI